MDESGMIRTQMVTRNRSESRRSAWDSKYDTTPQHQPVTSTLPIRASGSLENVLLNSFHSLA
jgi:hypothetical protein